MTPFATKSARAALLFLLLAACSTATMETPAAGDCVELRLWSNGFHTNLALPAALMDESHPLRRQFPGARHFLVGWGERDYYMAEDSGPWLGFKALFPNAAVMQAIAGAAPIEETTWPGDVVSFTVTKAGARTLSDAIGEAIVLDAGGAPMVLREGRVAGESAFLAAHGDFHLFNMCNHWTARRLREAGVPVRAWNSFTAPALMEAVRRKTARACPQP